MENEPIGWPWMTLQRTANMHIDVCSWLISRKHADREAKVVNVAGAFNVAWGMQLEG